LKTEVREVIPLAKELDLEVNAGATFGLSLRFRNPDQTLFNLTGFTGRLQVRKRIDADEVEIDIVPQLGGSDGLVTFGFSAEQTASLTELRYFYALELYGPNNLVIRLLEGKVNVSPRLVRD
jgi:hypothetical protein